MFMIILFFIFITLIYNYYVHYGKNGRLINLIPGPGTIPIFGNILLLQDKVGKCNYLIYFHSRSTYTNYR